ncbi:hypothetical protein PQG02_07135 [Nostoc sp. UHCC 0926]|uniref:hypothetical protein n=1 Tax=Nostoc sp. TaxID=1180 RepID=UPI0027A683AE|nr:hypothetical protein PQG02_07135 [Nostoc sp. UHCC 0926]
MSSLFQNNLAVFNSVKRALRNHTPVAHGHCVGRVSRLVPCAFPLGEATAVKWGGNSLSRALAPQRTGSSTRGFTHLRGFQTLLRARVWQCSLLGCWRKS